MPTIEISDKNQQGSLSFDLHHMLREIEPFADKLDWYVVDFEPGLGFGRPDGDVPSWVPSLYDAIKKGDGPIKVSWLTLKDFARNVVQTDVALLVGKREGSLPPNAPINPNDEQFEIVVQAVDSTFWAVTTADQALLARLRAHYTDTKLVEATRLYH